MNAIHTYLLREQQQVPPPTDWKDIGDQVKARRLLRGWSQRYLGRIVGLGAQSIQGLERGYGHNTPVGKFIAILKQLDMQMMLGA